MEVRARPRPRTGQVRTTKAHPQPSTQNSWHELRIEDALGALESGAAGLSTPEAQLRLARYGPNELATTDATPWYKVLLRQFLSPMIGILLIAMAITLLLQEWTDGAAIAVILGLNASLGYWQERKTEREVRALEQLSAPSSTVLREGARITLPAAELVPGDVVLLESGDRVPADLRLIEAHRLTVDESMLTGESEAVVKQTTPVAQAASLGDRTNMAFSATLVRSGRARGVVAATGTRTQIGTISELVQGPSGKTPLEELTHGLEKQIGVIIAVASALLFISGILIGNDPSQMFLTIVALAVATVPESLPIVLTVAMSIGVSRMAKRRALVRSLPAVETLGSTTIIGSDKTGTLTMNELTVRRIWTHSGMSEVPSSEAEAPATVRETLRSGALTNEATHAENGDIIGDAVDVAMAKAALRAGVITEEERRSAPLGHAPYEPELRLSQSVFRVGPDRVLMVKGAPDALAEVATQMATDDGPVPFDADLVEAANQQMARAGLRVLATAMRVLAPTEQIRTELPPPQDLTFLGLQGMEDPPRPGVDEAIGACRRAGIGIIMITGDQPVTALSIARQLGLPADGEPVTGAEIADLDDAELLARLRQVGVAARVSPQDKMRIVEVLQNQGEVVAVTGDGVNDAPALKRAALGVAMGASGTDVAREAADVVLTDDNFVTVVDAVEEGRIIFNAIRKATHFLLATGAASLVAVSASVFADMPLIFLPIQMLFINVVTNGVQDIALAFEGGEGDELRRPPRPASEGVLNRTLWLRTAVAGLWMALATLAVFTWGLDAGLTDAHARTLTVTLFVMMNFYLVHTSRFEYRSVFSDPLSNRLLLITSLLALGLHWAVMNWSVSASLMGFVPLSLTEWLACIGLGASVLVIIESEKALRRWWGRREEVSSTRVPAGFERGEQGRSSKRR